MKEASKKRKREEGEGNMLVDEEIPEKMGEIIKELEKEAKLYLNGLEKQDFIPLIKILKENTFHLQSIHFFHQLEKKDEILYDNLLEVLIKFTAVVKVFVNGSPVSEKSRKMMVKFLESCPKLEEITLRKLKRKTT